PVSLLKLLVHNVVNMSTVAVRRTALLSAGGFDSRLPTAEDHDLWIRVALLRDRNIHGIDDALACYRLRHGQMSKDWRKMQDGARMVLANAETLAPDVVRAVRPEAEAHLNRSLGFIAWEAGDHRQAFRFLTAALRGVCYSLLLDRRFWFLLFLVSSRLVIPGRFHKTLYRAIRRGQATLGAIQFATRPV